MKRCIICGNIEEDNSTACQICGNPFIDEENGSEDVLPDFPELKEPDAAEQTGIPDIPEDLMSLKLSEPPKEESSSSIELPEPPKEESPSSIELPEPPKEKSPLSIELPEPPKEKERSSMEVSESPKTEAVQRSVRTSGQTDGRQTQSVRQRRTHSGPQIYGQSESLRPELQNQGMIRRNVQGKPSQTVQVRAERETAQGQNIRQTRTAPQSPSPRAVNQRRAGLERPAVNQPQGAPSGRPAGQQPGYMGRPPVPTNRYRQVMETARGRLSSPLFAVIALLYTVYLAGAVAAIFMGELNYSLLVRLIQNFSLPGQLSGFVDMGVKLLEILDSGALAPNLVLLLPKLLFGIGLWLIFIMAKAARERMSGVGFGFVKLVVILYMIRSCVVVFAVIVLCVAVVIAAWVSGTKTVIVMSGILLVVGIAAALLVIMYYCCYLATFKTCRLNAATGEGYGRVSCYVAVIHIVLALTNVINLLAGIVNMEISGIVSAVGGMGWMILFSVWLLSYRRKMKEIEG